ncbi:MAG: hypothetical protein ABIO45_16685 [Burkholderiaceae bacterium]
MSSSGRSKGSCAQRTSSSPGASMPQGVSASQQVSMGSGAAGPLACTVKSCRSAPS